MTWKVGAYCNGACLRKIIRNHRPRLGPGSLLLLREELQRIPSQLSPRVTCGRSSGDGEPGEKEPLCVLMLTPVHMFNVLISIARGIHAGGNVRRDRKFGSKRLGSVTRVQTQINTGEFQSHFFPSKPSWNSTTSVPHSAPIHHVDAEVCHGVLKIIRLLLGEKKLERARRDRASY